MIVTQWEQGSPEWIEERLGVPSASNFGKIVKWCNSKKTWMKSKQQSGYMYELSGEIITGRPAKTLKNYYMKKGNDREDESLEYYSITKNVELTKVGFCYMDNDKKFGCSPDALIDFSIGPTGIYNIKSGIETKNKEPHLQAEILDGEHGSFVSSHFKQVQGCMLVTGAEWWDLLAYSRGMKQFVIRIERDEKFIDILYNELLEFDYELKKLVERIS